MVRWFAPAALLACAVHCGPSPRAPEPVAAKPAARFDDETGRPIRSITLATAGLDPAGLDHQADPCDDFYQFACGGWEAKNTIPPDRASFSRFTELIDRNEKALLDILEEARAQAQAASDPAIAAIGRYYGACMDEAAADKAGLAPVDSLLKAARGVRDGRSLRAAIAALHKNGVWAVFRLATDADFKDASRVILFVHQDGLGLPDRDYYLDPDLSRVRGAYRTLVEKGFYLAGHKAAQARRSAADVLKIETALARASRPAEELEDPRAIYNKIDRAGLDKIAPQLGWGAYFAALGRPDLKDVSADAPGFLTAAGKLLASERPATWRSYLEWQVLRSTAPLLSKTFVDLDFELARLVSGVAEPRPRAKRCVTATDKAMGEYLAQPYVAKFMSPSARESADRLVSEIESAMAAELAKVTWLEPQTRQRALEKLAAMAHLIGYPKKWRTYDVALGPVYGANALAARRFDLARELGKVGKPFDRSEWFITPPTVNAYYTDNANQMVFPAGILQPPFFAPRRPAAVNLGALGMVVGHELTHGFDAGGAQFDADGNMVNWWQDRDLAEFQRRGECVAAQYSQYEALPGVKVNGRLTLRENIADLGGIKLAFRAYRALRAGAASAIEADGFDEDQMFFLGVGQAWCTLRREEETRRRIKVDPHAPPRFRVNGSLSNLPDFHRAFGCEVGRPMHPASTCEVW
ncbi:MAG TPA: M13 family metallopeptidase [Kofleriaceae bacterium]|nr:M13 family metallopeptidase [Kofleriaceae bacterium]